MKVLRLIVVIELCLYNLVHGVPVAGGIFLPRVAKKIREVDVGQVG